VSTERNISVTNLGLQVEMLVPGRREGALGDRSCFGLLAVDGEDGKRVRKAEEIPLYKRVCPIH
jgi:hypothetical protein